MPDSTAGSSAKPETKPTTTSNATFKYTISGDAGTYGGPHEAGDNVPSSVPDFKLTEWEKAGVIRRVQPQPRKDKK